MSDKPFSTDIKNDILEYLGGQLYYFVAAMIAIVIIVCLEIIEIGIAEREGRPHIQVMPDLPFDDRRPRKLCRRIDCNISNGPLDHTSNTYFDQTVDPLPMDEFFSAVLEGCDHRADFGIRMKEDHWYNGQKDVLLDRVDELDLFVKVPFPANHDSRKRKMAGDLGQGIKVVEIMERDLASLEKLLKMEIET